MKPFTFNLMLLLQRVDAAWQTARQASPLDPHTLDRLRRRRGQVAERLRRSLATTAFAES